MSDGEDVLDVGGRRRPVLTGVLAALVLVAGIGGYLAVHDRGGGSPDRVAASTAGSPPPSTSVPQPSPTSPSSPALPPWPQVDAACGNTTFVPIVSTEPLRARTGLRLLVGPRLYRVDVDAGRAEVAAGVPAGEFAGSVATTGSGTYAILSRCDASTFGSPVTVVRLPADGPAQVVARGPYAQLLAGGDHPWGVIWPAESAGPIRLDPLDGGRRLVLPKNFEPLAGYGALIVGQQYTGNPDVAGMLEVIDPASGQVRVRLGRADSVTVGSGLVVWMAAGCRSCRMYTYDLAGGVRTALPAVFPAQDGLWGGAISADGAWGAFLRQSPSPGPYDMGHPGNPNEIVVLNLRTGALRVVPGVLLWNKSSPGLDFSADGTWLVIALDEGSGTRLLVWRTAGGGARDVPRDTLVRLPGKTALGASVTTLS